MSPPASSGGAFPENRALVSGVLAMCSVALASILVFQPTIQANINSGTVLAPTWALILTQYHAGTVFADSARSVMGAVLGACFGLFAYWLSDILPINDAVDQHVVATIFAMPFAFLLALGDPQVGSPLTPWIKADVAWLAMYIVTSFSKLNGYVAGRNAIIAFGFGSVSAVVVVGSLRIVSDLGSTKRRLLNAYRNFCAAQTHWLEGLTGFMASASGDHSTELDIRRDAASKALAQFQEVIFLAKVSDPWSVLKRPDLASDLSVTCVLMHSLLLAFRETICPESYCEDSLRTSFAPIHESFMRLRMGVVLATRPSTPDKVRKSAHSKLKDEASNLYNALLKNAQFNAKNRPADLPIGQQTVRLYGALFSLIFYALLADHFLSEVDSAIELYGPIKSMAVFWQDKWKHLVSAHSWRTKTTNFRFACRAVIAQQLVAQLALFIARIDPDKFGPYILWLMLPILFTFLGTVGGSVLKGTRRVVGTLIAGIVGCVTALANPGQRAAFFVEMLIVCFLAKLFSTHPKIGYAGLVGGFSWLIMILPSVDISSTSVLLNSVFYRMVLTVAGVIASALFSAILFPSFSASEMRTHMSNTVSMCSRLVNDGIAGVVAGTPFQEEGGLENFNAAAAVTNFRGAGDKALRSLQKHINVLSGLCEQARAEIGVIRNFCCITERTPGVSTLTESEQMLYRFIDSVLVLTALAASTRVTKQAHDLFFTEHVRFALAQFCEKVEIAGTKLAALIHGDQTVKIDDCYVSDRIETVDRNLMAVRRILGESRKLPDAIRGGSPMIYVFHFALGELAEFWDDFVRKLAGIPIRPVVSGAEVETSKISRNNSSHSSLHIC